MDLTMVLVMHLWKAKNNCQKIYKLAFHCLKDFIPIFYVSWRYDSFRSLTLSPLTGSTSVSRFSRRREGLETRLCNRQVHSHLYEIKQEKQPSAVGYIPCKAVRAFCGLVRVLFAHVGLRMELDRVRFYKCRISKRFVKIFSKTEK